MPFAAARAVKASQTLPWGAKAVWLEIYALDRGPEGCYMGASNLGRRLGVTLSTVKRHRATLLGAGLLATIERTATSSSWYPALPLEVPTGWFAAPPSEEDILALSAALDRHLTGGTHAPSQSRNTGGTHAPTGKTDWGQNRQATGGTHATPTGGTHAPTLGAPVLPKVGVRGRGGGGEGPALSSGDGHVSDPPPPSQGVAASHPRPPPRGGGAHAHQRGAPTHIAAIMRGMVQ